MTTTPVTTSWGRRLGEERVLPDDIVVEEPLALRLAVGDQVRRLATTMRTPGHDLELAVGWMVAEGLVRRRSDVLDVSRCARWEHGSANGESPGTASPPGPSHASHDHANLATVTLRGVGLPDLDHLDRHGVMTSACGVCGRASLDALLTSGVRPVPTTDATLDIAHLGRMPATMRAAQDVFGRTGGSHAAARFDLDGTMLSIREDVGRHNAMDKLVGAALLDGDLPLEDQVVVLSSRASYELVVKAAVAGVPILATAGAPTSLAIDVAHEFDVTLVTFLRHGGGTVHTHDHRLHDREVRA